MLREKSIQASGWQGQRLLILGCFLLSGATALTYEVVWVRMLTLVFGATTLSVGTVLACYMAGLALGSWFWCRHADSADNSLRLYAFLEGGIALSALATPYLFALVQGVYKTLFVGGLEDFSLLSIVRFFLCLPALLLPTFLMGGTLPILARFYTQSMARIGRGAGDLYAVNTLGAVLGTLLAGFTLIPTLGVQGTLRSAVVINLCLAVFAYLLSRTAAPVAREPKAEDVETENATAPPLVRLALWSFALSGAAAMILEVTWTRALVQVFGNSTYAFTTMLACFLIGLALGAAICGRLIDRAGQPIFVFAMLQLAVSAWAATATSLIEFLPELFVKAFARNSGSFTAMTLLQFVICCLLMLPATLALGAIFPTVTKIFASYSGGAGRGVGIPYAANTVGTVIGSLLAGFILLPLLGVELSIIIGALLNLGICAVILVRSKQRGKHPELVLAAGVLAIAACARLGIQRLDPRVMSSGVYLYADYFLEMEKANQSLRQAVEMKKLLYYRDGYGASLAVVQLPGGYIALQANGKTDASTGDLSTQRVCSHLPLLVKPEAKRVLVVGLASGCTLGSALLHPVEKVDCVEIEPAMIEAARYFNKWNHNCLSDKRVKIHLQDARNFMMMSNQNYDIITAEPTNPWIAGVNNLFTREYYRDCARHLVPGGIMCQWMPAYNFNTSEMKSALATFRSVYPYVSVWAFPHIRTDYFVIGSIKPQSFNPVALSRRLQGKVRDDMQAMDTTSLWEFMGALVMDAPAAEKFSRGAVLNTDEHPLLEFSTPRHLHEANFWADAMLASYTAGINSRLDFDPTLLPDVLRTLGVKPPNEPLKIVGFAARHPENVAVQVVGEGPKDIGVLQMRFENPARGVLLFPDTSRRPTNLQVLWDETPDYNATPQKTGDTWRLRRSVGGAALIGETGGASAAPLRVVLGQFQKR